MIIPDLLEWTRWDRDDDWKKIRRALINHAKLLTHVMSTHLFRIILLSRRPFPDIFGLRKCWITWGTGYRQKKNAPFLSPTMVRDQLD